MTNIEKLELIIQSFKLSNESPDCYLGEYDNVPFSVTILGIEPLSLLFKFKTNNLARPKFKLSAELKALRESKNANIDFTGGYGWLTLYDLTDYTENDVINFFTDLIHRLAEVEYIENCNLCMSCEQNKETKVILSGSQITRICNDCLISKTIQKERKEKQLNKENKLYLLPLIPLLIATSVIWAVFWLGYDKLFELFNTKRIILPNLVIAIVFTIIGLISSFPLGTLLRKSGIFNKIPKIIFIPAAIVFIIIVGESIYFTFTIKGSSFINVSSNIFSLLKLYKGDLLFFKFLFIMMLGTGLIQSSRKLEEKLEI